MKFAFLLLIIVGSAYAQENLDTHIPPSFGILSGPEMNWKQEITSEFSGEFTTIDREFHVDLTVNGIVLPEFSDDESFLMRYEEIQEEALADQELIGHHYYFSNIDGVACFQYDTSIRAGDSEPDNVIRNIVGYTCRHPENPGLGIQMQFEHGAQIRLQDDMDRLRIFATEFVETSLIAHTDQPNE